MYSDPVRRRRALAQAAAPAPVQAGRVRLSETWVTPLPEGALWLDDSATLVVSDLHLEKGSAYVRGGNFLPPYDTRATLKRLSNLYTSLSPRRVIALGDTFHDRGASARLDADDRAKLSDLVKRVDWIWIAGNHDPAPPVELGGVVHEAVDVEGIVFRHEPEPGAKSEVAGHLHPCARVAGSAGSVRRRCFALDGARLVMPAFGAYAGGLNVLDKAFEPLFPGGLYALVMGRSKLYPTPAKRLIGD